MSKKPSTTIPSAEETQAAAASSSSYPAHKYQKMLNYARAGEVAQDSTGSENDHEGGNGHSDDEDDDDLHQQKAVMNLLDIRDSTRWDPSRLHAQAVLNASLQAAAFPQTVLNNRLLVPTTLPNKASAAAAAATQGSSAPLTTNTVTILSEMKGTDYSITKIYEPKFMQIFQNYCESMKQPIDISKHLMSVCLENLIPFSCWARESNNRSAWIKQTLDDNIDLRPEVRNGLSMILIYCMSTAQARQKKDEDMFSVLQEAETGLGIVNKTSLKIYNDPFNYFNFLKSCMSGLIDAGKIPENERQNQPKKPKRQSENKEEILAYLQLKNMLVTLLNHGENALARTRVQQISTIWQHRQKNIRNRRFATALAVISAPNSLKQKQLLPLLGPAAGLMGFDGDIPLIPNIPGFHIPTLVSDASNPLKALAATEQYEMGESNPLTSSSMNTLASPTNKPSSNKRLSSTLSDTEPPSTAADANPSLSNLVAAANALANTAIAAELASVSNTSANNNSSTIHTAATTTAATAPIPTVNNTSLGLIPPSAYTLTAADISTLNSSKDLDVPSNPSKYLRSIISSGSKLCPTIPAVRFERVSGKEWEFKENKIFNIESLVMNVNSVFCLIDESKLSPEERQSKKIISTGSGFISLQSELQQRGALITSWPKFDHSHMLDFLECWLAQDQTQSLVSFWNQGVSNGAQSRASSLFPASKESSGNGIIAYEVVMQAGIVLRKNDKLGIREDCWRLIYPSDLLNETQAVTFGGFLMNFFPQLRPSLNKLTTEQISGTVVKYFPHKIDPPVLQPPRGDHGVAYQTIGTLDESTPAVLARFETSLSFHDIVIQLD